MAFRTCWGIDIGGYAVKGVKLRRTKAGVEIVSADVVALKGEAAAETSFGRDRRIWIALDELARRNRIGYEPLVLSVPARATFVRPLDLVVVGARPLSELVQFEVQQFIPFGLDAVIWDYEMFGGPGQDNHQKGVVVAVKKEVLNNYLMSLAAARLQADDVLSAPLALYNLARYELEGPRPTLLIDLGATCTDLVLVRDEGYAFSTVPVGGDLVSRAIQERFNLDAERAEAAKRNVGLLRGARRVLEAILPSLRRYAGEVQSAERRLRSEAGGAPPARVVLFGGAVETVGLSKVLSQALECEVEVFSALRRIAFHRDADRARIEPLVPQLAVALGLALRGIGEAATRVSLMSAAVVRRKIAARARPCISAALAVLAVLVAWIVAFGGHELRTMHAARVQMQERVRDIEAHVDLWKRLQGESPAGQALQTYARLGEHRLAWLTVLERIISILPPANRLPGSETSKAWLLDLDVVRAGEDLEATSWWAVRGRGNPLADADFVQRIVLGPLQKVAGFEDFRDTDGSGEGQRYADELAPRAKPVEGGRYRVFPVSFRVVPARLGT